MDGSGRLPAVPVPRPYCHALRPANPRRDPEGHPPLAAIDDLIAQVDDAALRRRLSEDADRLRRDKKFS